MCDFSNKNQNASSLYVMEDNFILVVSSYSSNILTASSKLFSVYYSFLKITHLFSQNGHIKWSLAYGWVYIVNIVHVSSKECLTF